MDRQLDRAKGDWAHRVRAIRFAQNMMVAAIAINLIGVVGLNLVFGVYDRRLSVAFGVLWLVLTYIAVRQRKHLNGRMAQAS